MIFQALERSTSVIFSRRRHRGAFARKVIANQYPSVQRRPDVDAGTVIPGKLDVAIQSNSEKKNRSKRREVHQLRPAGNDQRCKPVIFFAGIHKENVYP